MTAIEKPPRAVNAGGTARETEAPMQTAGYYLPGVTYAIHSDPFDGWVKIGRTAYDPNGTNVLSRLRGCQTGNPRKLIVGAVWALEAEADLHRIYAEFRGSGEWFRLPLDLVIHMASVADSIRPIRDLLIDWPPERVRTICQEAA